MMITETTNNSMLFPNVHETMASRDTQDSRIQKDWNVVFGIYVEWITQALSMIHNLFIIYFFLSSDGFHSFSLRSAANCKEFLN